MGHSEGACKEEMLRETQTAEACLERFQRLIRALLGDELHVTHDIV